MPPSGQDKLTAIMNSAADACPGAGQGWTDQELGEDKEAAPEGPTSH